MRSDASNCAAASGPSVSTPSNRSGRSSGVSVRKVKMPETSGCPSGVRSGMVRSLVWASAAGAASARRRIGVQRAVKVFLGMVGLVSRVFRVRPMRAMCAARRRGRRRRPSFPDRDPIARAYIRWLRLEIHEAAP